MADYAEKINDNITSINSYLTSSLDAVLEQNYDKVQEKLDTLIDIVTEIAKSSDGEGKKGKSDNKEEEKTAKTVESLGKGVESIMKGLKGFDSKAKKGGEMLIEFLDKFMTKERMKSFSDSSFSLAMNNLGMMGESILKLAKSLTLATPWLILGIPAGLLMVPFIIAMVPALLLLAVLSPIMVPASWSLRMLGRAMERFGKALLLSAIAMLNPLTILVPIVFVAIIDKFAISALMMSKIGRKAFNDYAASVRMITVSMLLMTASILLCNFITPKSILGFMAVLGTLFIITKTFGKPKAAVETVAAGLSLILLTTSFAIAAVGLTIMNNVKWDTVLKGIGVLLTLAILAKIMAKGKTSLIIGGGILLALSGAMAIAALGMRAMEDVSIEAFLMGIGTLVVLAGIAIALSYFSGMILLGAAGLLVLALVIPVAAKAMSEASEYELNGDNINLLLGKTLLAAATFIPLSLMSIPVLFGAGVALAIGKALLSLGRGFGSFSDVNLSHKQINQIYKSILTMTSVFAGVGLSLRIAAAAKLGASTVLSVGKALFAIGLGLQQFNELDIDKFTNNVDDPKKSPIYILVSSIIKPFEELGNNLTESIKPEDGFFKGLGKVFLGTKALKNAIEVVGGVGGALGDIASAVQNYAEMKYTDANGKQVELSSEKLLQVANNIKTIVTSITKTLTDIGQGSGYWAQVFGSDGVSKGKEMISGVGTDLCAIADMVMKIAQFEMPDDKGNIKKIPEDLFSVFDKEGKEVKQGRVSKIIENMILSTTSVLIKLGKKEPIGTLTNSDFENGLEAFKKMQGEIGNIAKLVSAFSTEIANGNEKNSPEVRVEKFLTALINPFIFKEDSKGIDYTRLNLMERVTDKLVDVAKNEAKLGKAAGHISNISNSLNSTFDKLKSVEDEKIKSVKEFFDTLIEYDKVQSDIIDKKLKRVDETMDRVNKYDNKPYSTPDSKPSSTTEKSGKKEEGNVKMKDVFAALTATMDEINTKLTDIKNKLQSGAVNVIPDNKTITKLTDAIKGK